MGAASDGAATNFIDCVRYQYILVRVCVLTSWTEVACV